MTRALAFRSFALFAALFLVAAGCSDSPKSKSGKFVPNSTVNSQNNNVSTCGNGTLDPGEACDPTITSGEGACPTECTQETACGSFELQGTAAACSAACVLVENACGDEDGCCPTGCDSTSDVDCTNTCGDGTVESPELCDGDCPVMCDDGVACTTDDLIGSAATCDARCNHAPITACANDDGCCPAGCTADNDNDCSGSCGDGTVDPGEICDGNCPTECPSPSACNPGVLLGSAAACSAQCSTMSITSCRSGDGCCPAGCTFNNDNDCSCTPRTCAQMGAQCGTTDDGCGNVLNCPACPGGGNCVNNQCEPPDIVGNACTSDGQCGANGGCLTEAQTSLPGGYCTTGCNSNADCASGNCWVDNGICLDSCSSNADCRSGYECFDWSGDSARECGPVANGFGDPGDACSGYSDCRGGQGGFCIENPDFTGGYCTIDCTAGNSCGAGSHCWNSNICVASCTSNAQCRSGYQCHDRDSDGQSECWPFASGSGQVGEPCGSIQDCAGGLNGFCAADDGQGNWPSGYCSHDCGNGVTCPTGSVCYDPDGSGDGFCLDSCMSDTDCRSSYFCDSSLGLATNVCLY